MPFNFTYFPTNCTASEDFRRDLEIGFISIQYIIMPCCIVFGLLANVIALIAFVRQKGPNFYPISLAANQTLETVFAIFPTFYSIMYGYSTQGPREGAASDWFRSNYPLMWLKAHMLAYPTSVCTSVSFLLMISMAADRVFALRFPAKYKVIDHKLHKAIALVSCIAIACAVNLYVCFIYTVIIDKTDGHRILYLTVIKIDSNHSFLLYALQHVRNVAALIAFVLLVTLNVLLIRAFRQYCANADKILADQRSKQLRKQQERRVVLFSVCVSIVIALKYVPFFAINAARWASSTHDCVHELLIPVAATLLCLDCVDFYVVFLFNKQLRRAVYDLMPFCRRVVKKITGKSDVEMDGIQMASSGQN